MAAPMALKAPQPAQGKPSVPVGLVEKIREPLAFVLQQPEEQTDNWDDDFEDGPSFSKLQGTRSIFCLFLTAHQTVYM